MGCVRSGWLGAILETSTLGGEAEVFPFPTQIIVPCTQKYKMVVTLSLKEDVMHTK